LHKISYTGRLLPAEPLAWATGQIFAPTQKFAQLQKTGKEQNISMRQILVYFLITCSIIFFQKIY